MIGYYPLGKVILNAGETEFALGLLLVGATRTTTFEAHSQTFSACPDWQKEKPGGQTRRGETSNGTGRYNNLGT
jgi:hypothetical protein